jgi:hypothetical protein
LRVAIGHGAADIVIKGGCMMKIALKWELKALSINLNFNKQKKDPVSLKGSRLGYLGRREAPIAI